MRNLIQVYVHYVWATWDRLPIITQEIERDVHRYIRAVCEEEGCPVLAVGGMPDHVHLLVAMNTTLSIGQLMQRVKGGSSRFVTQTLCPGEWFAWQGSYGAFAVSSRDKKKIVAYIDNQKTHHADGTLLPNAEKTHLDPLLPPSLVSTQVEIGPKAG